MRDLAAANGGNSNVSILLGVGDGTFGAAANITVGATPVAIVEGDFNRDGKTDLATANAAGNEVSILLGSGDGTFIAAVQYDAGNDPESLTVGDFNNDGKPDLATANRNSHNVSILIGDGTGVFATSNFGAGASPFSITTADFNNDGKADLAVADTGNSFSILLGAGNGTFGTPTSFTAGMAPSSVSAGDFNMDGNTDLAVANLGDTFVGVNGNVSVLLGVGDGTFGSAANYTAGVHPDAVTTGDFDRDGRPDLAVSDLDNKISILYGAGNGTFAGPENFGAGALPRMAATGDFSGDGKTDLAVVNWSSNNVSVLINTAPTLIGSQELGGVFFIEDGKRRGIASTSVFENWGFDWNDVVWAPLSEVNAYPQGDNLTLLALHDGCVHLVQNNVMRPIFDPNTFEIFKVNWGLDWSDVTPVSDGVFNSKTMGDLITFPLLVTYSNGGTVYYMDSDGKRPIQNAPTFEHWFTSAAWGDIFYTMNNSFLAGYPSPAPWSVLASNGGGVFIISDTVRHPIPSPEVFNAHAATDPVYNWNNIYPASDNALTTLTTLGAPIS